MQRDERRERKKQQQQQQQTKPCTASRPNKKRGMKRFLRKPKVSAHSITRELVAMSKEDQKKQREKRQQQQQEEWEQDNRRVPQEFWYLQSQRRASFQQQQQSRRRSSKIDIQPITDDESTAIESWGSLRQSTGAAAGKRRSSASARLAHRWSATSAHMSESSLQFTSPCPERRRRSIQSALEAQEHQMKIMELAAEQELAGDDDDDDEDMDVDALVSAFADSLLARDNYHHDEEETIHA